MKSPTKLFKLITGTENKKAIFLGYASLCLVEPVESTFSVSIKSIEVLWNCNNGTLRIAGLFSGEHLALISHPSLCEKDLQKAFYGENELVSKILSSNVILSNNARKELYL